MHNTTWLELNNHKTKKTNAYVNAIKRNLYHLTRPYEDVEEDWSDDIKALRKKLIASSTTNIIRLVHSPEVILPDFFNEHITLTATDSRANNHSTWFYVDISDNQETAHNQLIDHIDRLYHDYLDETSDAGILIIKTKNIQSGIPNSLCATIEHYNKQKNSLPIIIQIDEVFHTEIHELRFNWPTDEQHSHILPIIALSYQLNRSMAEKLVNIDAKASDIRIQPIGESSDGQACIDYYNKIVRPVQITSK